MIALLKSLNVETSTAQTFKHITGSKNNFYIFFFILFLTLQKILISFTQDNLSTINIQDPRFLKKLAPFAI